MRHISVRAAAMLAGALGGCQTLNEFAGSVSGSAGDAPSAPAAAQAPAPTVAATNVTAPGIGLAGMTADGLRSAWGEPTLKRSETGAELWQYGGPDCAVLVYFYPGAGNVMTVSRAEAVPGGADETAVASCAKAAGKPSVKPIS